MKFGAKDIIIAFLLVLVAIVIFGRKMSFADAMTSPAPGSQAKNDATGMPSGAILPKTADEVCSTKYGDGWIDFSPMLCKKI
jgi:hypothetical protein